MWASLIMTYCFHGYRSIFQQVCNVFSCATFTSRVQLYPSLVWYTANPDAKMTKGATEKDLVNFESVKMHIFQTSY